jgi:glycerol-3-phosphate acyltransferase PlsX
VVGRIKGIERTPLGTLIPTTDGVALLVDSGANVDTRPSHLVQFAKMGSIYMENVVGIKNPRVAIVNVGVEEEKGNTLVKETFPLLKECAGLNFTGSIEAREIPHGGADVIVCDGFVGNVILKLYEGVGGALISKVKQSLLTNLKTKIGAVLIKPALKATLKSFDASQYGGAPMLGLNGLVVKTHGSAKANEVCNSIIQCVTFKAQNINEKIKESLSTAKTVE